jgi:hypothetical protein
VEVGVGVGVSVGVGVGVKVDVGLGVGKAVIVAWGGRMYTSSVRVSSTSPWLLAMLTVSTSPLLEV